MKKRKAAQDVCDFFSGKFEKTIREVTKDFSPEKKIQFMYEFCSIIVNIFVEIELILFLDEGKDKARQDINRRMDVGFEHISDGFDMYESSVFALLEIQRRFDLATAYKESSN